MQLQYILILLWRIALFFYLFLSGKWILKMTQEYIVGAKIIWINEHDEINSCCSTKVYVCEAWIKAKQSQFHNINQWVSLYLSSYGTVTYRLAFSFVYLFPVFFVHSNLKSGFRVTDFKLLEIVLHEYNFCKPLKFERMSGWSNPAVAMVTITRTTRVCGHVSLARLWLTSTWLVGVPMCPHVPPLHHESVLTQGQRVDADQVLDGHVLDLCGIQVHVAERIAEGPRATRTADWSHERKKVTIAIQRQLMSMPNVIHVQLQTTKNTNIYITSLQTNIINYQCLDQGSPTSRHYSIQIYWYKVPSNILQNMLYGLSIHQFSNYMHSTVWHKSTSFRLTLCGVFR